jgi:hypothetical protein
MRNLCWFYKESTVVVSNKVLQLLCLHYQTLKSSITIKFRQVIQEACTTATATVFACFQLYPKVNYTAEERKRDEYCHKLDGQRILPHLLIQ